MAVSSFKLNAVVEGHPYFQRNRDHAEVFAAQAIEHPLLRRVKFRKILTPSELQKLSAEFGAFVSKYGQRLEDERFDANVRAFLNEKIRRLSEQ